MTLVLIVALGLGVGAGLLYLVSEGSQMSIVTSDQAWRAVVSVIRVCVGTPYGWWMYSCGVAVGWYFRGVTK